VIGDEPLGLAPLPLVNEDETADFDTSIAASLSRLRTVVARRSVELLRSTVVGFGPQDTKDMVETSRALATLAGIQVKGNVELTDAELESIARGG
jgi:hypothetical protein